MMVDEETVGQDRAMVDVAATVFPCQRANMSLESGFDFRVIELAMTAAQRDADQDRLDAMGTATLDEAVKRCRCVAAWPIAAQLPRKGFEIGGGRARRIDRRTAKDARDLLGPLCLVRYR